MAIKGAFHFTHMRAFIYSIRHIYYRWTRAYAWNGTHLYYVPKCAHYVKRNTSYIYKIYGRNVPLSSFEASTIFSLSFASERVFADHFVVICQRGSRAFYYEDQERDTRASKMSYGRPPPRIDGMVSLKVDNLTYRTTPEDLRRVFERCGEVGDIYIPRDRFTRESRGFAFVRWAGTTAIANVCTGTSVTRRFNWRPYRMLTRVHRRRDLNASVRNSAFHAKLKPLLWYIFKRCNMHKVLDTMRGTGNYV